MKSLRLALAATFAVVGLLLDPFLLRIAVLDTTTTSEDDVVNQPHAHTSLRFENSHQRNVSVPIKEASLPQSSSSSSSYFDDLIQDLETKQYKYYMYDHPNMTMMHIRQRRLTHGARQWNFTWGSRFRGYSRWEIEYLHALEHHAWRTFQPDQADLIVISIPINCISVAGQVPNDTRLALQTLYQQPLFRQYPEKHVWFTFLEYLFEPQNLFKAKLASGITERDYQKLQPITIATYVDHHSWWLRVPDSYKDRAGWSELKNSKGQPMTQHEWSMSFMGSAMDTLLDQPHKSRSAKLALKPLTMEEFHNKTYHFFYHTRKSSSKCNSTPYRHALVQDPTTATKLLQPSSIGFDIANKEEWKQQFANSKFCPCIRGDNPQTRCLWRSIQRGCLPVVISNVWPYYAPIFKSLLQMSDYAVLVDEEEFLQHPAETLNHAVTSLSTAELARKIDGLNLVRRLILPNHRPDSLFVQAFCRETMASRQPEYYDYAAVGGADKQSLPWSSSLEQR